MSDNSMPERKRISLLIPYRKSSKGMIVFLQKRSSDAPRLPNYFGFFGGHGEREETPEEALLREIKEELDIDITGYELLRKSESEYAIKHGYVLEVGDNFENEVRVLEGDYGKFFTREEAMAEPMLIEEDKSILRTFFEKYETDN